MPESMLSEVCGVSRTPIRSTLKLLENKDIVTRREEEGGFRRASGIIFSANEASLLEDVENSLATGILNDRTERRITDVQSVSALVRRYDTPRSAVLNALKILGSDGIVTQLPGRAWAFQPILDTPNSLSESFAFRLSLEPQAILSPGFSMDSQGVGMMRQQMESFEHFNLNPTQQLERYVAPTWDAIVDTVIHAEAGLQNLIRRIKPDGIVLDNVIMFPAIANAGVPWVRVVSCAETEIPDPNVPPYLSGMTADDKDRKAFDASYIACTARAHKRYSGFRQTCGLTSLPRGQFLETSDYLNLLLAPSAISLRVI